MAKRDIYQEITDKIAGLLEQVNLEDYEAPFAALAAKKQTNAAKPKKSLSR